MSSRNRIFIAALVITTLAPAAAHAYIGPGAGFALVSSFLTFLIAFFTAFFAIFTLPIRMLWKSLRRKKPEGKARVRNVIMLGLDGLEPTITEKMMADGELPNFSKLAERGMYSRLGTSNPAMSPVAWSCFSTGSDPSYHGIFDFLKRDPRTYLPLMSTSATYGRAKFLKLGPFSIPTKKGGLRFLRKSISFWKILSDYGVFSTVLRVPITFPPEKFNGLLIAGMDVPDLRGTMGTFTYYTQADEAAEIGGNVVTLKKNGGGPIHTTIEGPASPINGQTLELPLVITRSNGEAVLDVNGEKHTLKERVYSPLIRLTFKAATNLKFSGIARFYVTQMNGDFKMYVTPIQIDPDRPVMPISSPPFYATYLSKLLGPFTTAGLAEDTWALNEKIIDEQGFLDQTYLIYEERRKHWFHSLDKLRRGVVICVFDISDRLQHMTFRYLDEDHPANAGKDTVKHKDALFDMYREMDKLLGETLAYERKDTAVFVMSDHGFKTFKRGINLNSWLRDNGYLTLKDGTDGKGEYLADVDWSKTKAYGLGLGGIYLNIAGRERHGIVDSKDREALKQEIIDGLVGLIDPKNGQPSINAVTNTEQDFKGPYRKDGPDMLVGFAEGWRVSWDCARGLTTPEIFEDNVKAWSGDHC
ncbi:MAG: alkaline phosphatase family protein, partial [bacterium]|nr:alkaline phosphatase family protein [bacterium]